ncbi:MAG: signal recognition particle-docking protein FtsY [Ruminococcus sp.]|nr:signal recognition particle-docking protein FtsY [Ruminococcus sp.]
MAFFGKKDKDKKKKGFFSRWKQTDEQNEIDEIQAAAEEAVEVLEEQNEPLDDITQAVSERERSVREEEERRRAEAEVAAEQEMAQARALAAQAAQLASLSQDVEELETLDDEEEDEDEYASENPVTESEETAEEDASEEEAYTEAAEETETEKETDTVTEEAACSSDETEADSEDEPEEEADSEEEPVKQEKKGIFAKIREGLRKTKESMMSKIQGVLGSFTKIDEELFDELEETMIMGDMGVETSETICNALRKRIKERGITDPKEIMTLIQEIISEMLGEDQELKLDTKPSVIVVIGVNGAGKTTTIGKLCRQLKDEGKKVIVAAADTFRAAAIDQLEVWTNRSGVELVKHAEGSDPGAVVYDAIDAAKARGCDVLICDTAGRLHNKKNLMQELAKINRIIASRAEGCSVETLLVLDATTGQNAVNQARLFKEVADISGIVLTKLDGTAKGGIIVSIKNELDIPVKLIGVGEKIDDLQPFHAKDFVDALFEKEERV